MSTRDTATAIGAGHATVARDVSVSNETVDTNPPAETEEPDSLLDVEIIGGNHGVQRRGPLCARVGLIPDLANQDHGTDLPADAVRPARGTVIQDFELPRAATAELRAGAKFTEFCKVRGSYFHIVQITRRRWSYFYAVEITRSTDFGTNCLWHSVLARAGLTEARSELEGTSKSRPRARW